MEEYNIYPMGKIYTIFRASVDGEKNRMPRHTRFSVATVVTTIA